MPARWSGLPLPPFVGREPQLRVLNRAWAAAGRGAQQVVIVGAEAGGGKSRLVAEAAALIARNDATVLLGSALAETGNPYDPFVEPLAVVVRGLEEGSLSLQAAGSDAAAQLRLLRLITQGPDEATGPRAVHQPALFAAAAAALEAVSAVRSTMLVLEDLHWASESALMLLRFAVARTADLPILFLVTMRTGEPDLSPEVIRVVSDLARRDGVTRMELEGLSREEIAEYLVRGPGLSSAQARRAAGILHDQTAGNPYLLREVCREHAADLAAGLLSHGTPLSTGPGRDWTGSRVERLAPAQRRVLETAAVIGEQFDVRLLAASLVPAADRSAEPDAAVDTTYRALESAAALGLVEWLPGRSDEGRFPHAIAHQAVLNMMSRYEQARAHARVGLALENQFPAADRRVLRLAHHFSNAAALGFAEQAARYLEAAGDAAAAKLSHAEAAAQYERAAGYAAHPQQRDDLLLASGRAYLRATHVQRTRQLAEAVAATGTPEQKLRAALLFEAASWQGHAHDRRSVELLDAAMRSTAAGGPPRGRILATAALSRAMSFGDRTGPSAALREEAILAARESGEDGLLAEVLAISLLDGLGLAGLADRLQRADELTRLVGSLGEVELLGPAAFHRCVSHYVLGDPVALEQAYLDLSHMARATNEPYWTLAFCFVTFGLQLMRCEWVQAAETLERTSALAWAFEGGYAPAQGPWSLQSYMLRRETGQLEAVRGLLTGDEDPTRSWAPGLLALYCELGMVDPAAQVLHWLLASGLETLQRSASWPGVLSFLVDATVMLEDREAAHALLPFAQRFIGHNLVVSEFLAPLGSGHRLIGELQSILGVGSAEESFVRALAADTTMGSPLHRATTLVAHARHLQRHGLSPDRSQALAAEALGLCDRYQLERVRRLLGPDAAVRGGAVAASSRIAGDGLTPRETEVLRLLGRGLTNREIAATLVISEYTAGNHVRNILAKIQCTNRTQAAMYAAKHGLTGPIR
jgi:DNA-binding CsgD family transcriptional regulator